ncbi:MAG: hypothetical protein HN730_08180, partial [Bdellovibrionales bacterium]|nr:hypothetical protein [Bdellovibrionales bacterium]
QQQAKKSAAAEKKRLAEQQARENARKKKLADQQAIVDARKKKLADQQAIEDARKKKIADEQAAIEAKKKLGEKKTDQPIVGGAGGVSQDISAKIGKIVSQIDDTAQIKVDLQKKIYSQTAPPAYTKTGRGLVYNCVGQHWACVNKNTYIKCRGNMMWNKQGRKLPECITRNVYRNKQDCFTVQTHNINTIKNTSFCK